MAESSKARACSHPIYGIASSNPVGSMDVSVLSTVLQDRGFCDRPITNPEEFCRL